MAGNGVARQVQPGQGALPAFEEVGVFDGVPAEVELGQVPHHAADSRVFGKVDSSEGFGLPNGGEDVTIGADLNV